MSQAAQKASTPARASSGRSRTPSRRGEVERPAGGPGAAGALQGLAGNRAVTGLLGGGAPLPPQVRDEMESRFGTDFDGVRIHDSPTAHASAAAWHAKAYTHGSDIVFGANRFTPHSPTGKRLLAHELAHVVQQQRGGAVPRLDAAASHEHGAETAANAVLAGSGAVSVAGATGVGVAREEDESWGAALHRKYQEVKEKIPPEYRDKVQKAADVVADKVVDSLVLPLGPTAVLAADGLGSALLHSAQKTVEGQEGANDELKGFGRDKVLEGLGAAKGVATQVTEVVDTAMWVGNEYKGMRDKAAEAIGGPQGTAGNVIARHAIDLTARVLPGMQALPDLASASDAAKSVGLVDPETKQASITAPMSGKLNEWAKAAEDKLGAKPRDPEMFTPMEKAEIASSLGVQVALSAVGAEEVKVAMNVVGALSGIRAIVETIRHDKDWATSPRFWGHVIGLGLSIVGLAHSMAASKITTLVLKYGGVAAAVPALAQMALDYYKLESNPNMPEDERKKLEASIKQDWIAAIHIVKDAILHVAQSQGGKPKGGGTEEPAGPTNKAGAPGGEGGAATQAGKGTPTPEDTKGGTTQPKTAPIEDPTAKPPPVAKPLIEPPAKPVVTGDDSRPPVDTTTHGDGVTPIGSGKGKPQSAASKKLEANLARQRADEAGSVTKLPTRKAGAPTPDEPVLQAVPEVLDVPEKIAVGQTHGPGDGGGGKPKRSLVEGGSEPTVASLKKPGGKGTTPPESTPLQAAKSASGGGKGKGSGGKTTKAAKTQPTKTAKGGRPDADALPPLKAGSGRGENNEPLVAVRVAGGGGKTKNTYYEEGSPRFDEAARDPRFVVVPKSEAEGVFRARPVGEPPNTNIQPVVKNGVQMESGGAGAGKANQHSIMGRAELHADPDVKAATFPKSIGAAHGEAQGYRSLIESGEYGVQRPGNVSTGGVDAITASVPKDGPATVYLNDFTTPGTSKGAKPTHANWVKELGQAIQDPRFGFGNAQTDRAVLSAIASGKVMVRPVHVEFGPEGPVVTPKGAKPVDVPPEIRKAASDLLAKLPPEGSVVKPPVQHAPVKAPAKARVTPPPDSGGGRKLAPAKTQAELKFEAEIDAALSPVDEKKKGAVKLPQ